MTDGEQPVEARIEELVKLEQELQQPSGTDAGGVYEEGVIAGAARIPASEVPEDYPVPVESEQALRIDVETDGGVVKTYMEWAPDQGGSDHVQKLLDALGRQPDEFAEIFGDRVALDHRDGYHGIDDEGTAQIHRTGDPPLGIDLGFLEDFEFERSGKLVAGLLVVTAIGTQLYAWELPGSNAILAFLLLPGAIAYDANRMKSELDWDPKIPLWALASFIPFFNLPLVTAYLVRRREKRRSLPGEVSPAWLYAVALGGVASLITFPMLFAGPTAYTPSWAFAMVMVPLAVYHDFDYVETDGHRTEKRVGVALVAAALSFLFMGCVAAGAYLLYRLR